MEGALTAVRARPHVSLLAAAQPSRWDTDGARSYGGAEGVIEQCRRPKSGGEMGRRHDTVMPSCTHAVHERLPAHSMLL